MLEVQFDGDTICVTEGESLPVPVRCKCKVANQVAYLMDESFRLSDASGVWTEGTDGDYIVIGTDGNPSIVTAFNFARDYEIV